MLSLKILREEKRASQQEVADYLGITRQAYSNYEIGKRSPDNEALLKLAEYFDITVDSLLRGEVKAEPPPPVPDDLTEDVKKLIQTLSPEQATLLRDLAAKCLGYVKSRT